MSCAVPEVSVVMRARRVPLHATAVVVPPPVAVVVVVVVVERWASGSMPRIWAHAAEAATAPSVTARARFWDRDMVYASFGDLSAIRRRPRRGRSRPGWGRRSG